MKLRSKFVILIFGILLVPFIAASIIFIFRFTMLDEAYPYEVLPTVDHVIDSGARDLTESEVVRRILKQSEDIELIVEDETNQKIYSTLEELNTNDPLLKSDVYAYIRQHLSRDHQFQFNFYSGTSEDTRLLYIQMGKNPLFQRMISKSFFTPLEGILLFLVLATSISLLIIRSFNKKVTMLDKAAKRIAGGDLDFQLPIEGNDELTDLTKSFEQMRIGLKEEYAKRSRFIMGVSHDLKTPLASIKGYVEAIQDGLAENPEKLTHFMKIIQDKTQLLGSRISDLIEYVKMDMGEWKMKHADIVVTDFLQKIARHYKEDALLLDRVFKSEIDLPEDQAVQMDSNLIERVLENLIGNAIRYTKEEDIITLRSGIKNNILSIAVHDTGSGVDDEEMDRIFSPFYRGNNIRPDRQDGGFGLGLATVKSIITAHGWTITAKKEGGMSFIIEIPLEE